MYQHRVELKKVWRDPEFDPVCMLSITPGFLQIPTPFSDHLRDANKSRAATELGCGNGAGAGLDIAYSVLAVRGGAKG